MTDLTTDDRLRSNKTLTWIIYGLYAGSFFVGITGIAAIIMNYVKRGDVAGTYLESHFTWQIRTLLIADTVWVIYRLVIGAIRLNDNRPVVEGKWGLEA